MTDILDKVKSLIDNIDKKQNPFLYEEKSHPHQSEKVKTSDYEFRKVPYELVSYYNNWINFTFLSKAMRQYPHLLKVFDYIKYRTLTMGKEGFSFTLSSILDDTSYYHGFNGDREIFYKYLYILEELGIIFLDKRLYRNYLWINFDIIGNYEIKKITDDNIISNFDDYQLEAHNRILNITSYEYIENLKKYYKIYNFNILDDKAKLEFLWYKMIGYKNLYDMIPKKQKEKYLSKIDLSKKTGIRKLSLEHAINNINKEIDDYFKKYRLSDHVFKYGGLITMQDKKVKSLKLIDLDTITINENGTINNIKPIKTKKEVLKKLNSIDKPIHKKPIKTIDWDTVDLSSLDIEEFNKKFSHKNSLINYFDFLLVKGLNSSNRAKSLNILYENTLRLSKIKTTSENKKYAYIGIINGIYNNLYKRMINKGFDNNKIRDFIFWVGKNYFNLINSLKWITDKTNVEPSLAIFSSSEKCYLADAFFSSFERYLIKKYNAEQANKSSIKLTDEKNNGIITNNINSDNELELIKLKTSIENELTAKMTARIKNYDDKLKKYAEKLRSLNIDPLDLI